MHIKVNHLGKVVEIDKAFEITYYQGKLYITRLSFDCILIEAHEIADIEITFPEYENEENFTINPRTNGK